MDVLVERKIIIVGQAILIWTIGFLFYLFFHSLVWGEEIDILSLLSSLVLMVSSAVFIWLNMDSEKQYGFLLLVQTLLVWIILSLAIDYFVHLKTGLLSSNFEVYMMVRGFHFFWMIPSGIITWLVKGRAKQGKQEKLFRRFIGRSSR